MDNMAKCRENIYFSTKSEVLKKATI